MINSISIESILKLVLVICILFVPVSIGVLNPSAEIAAVLGLILAIVLLPFLYHKTSIANSDIALKVKLLFILYFCIGLVSLILVEDTKYAVHSIGTTSHFLFFVFIFSALQRTDIRIGWFWFAVVTGAILNGVNSLYFSQRGSVNPILYGNISIVLAFASLLSWRYFSQFRLGFILPILGFCLGLLASFYSLARGGWVAIPALFVVYVIYLLITLENRKRVLLSIVGLSLAIIMVGISSGDKIIHRVDLAVKEVQDYFAGENHKTSIGYRLEVYKGAIQVIQENPFGVGFGGEMHAINALTERAVIRDVTHIHNVHNQILQEGVAKGIFGILSYLLLMGYLFTVFAKGMYSSHNREINTVGVIMVVGFFIFGFTNITFTHGVFNTFFVCMVALLLSIRDPIQKIISEN
jgi:O-antigen ligase